jgi:hypothetical protein
MKNKPKITLLILLLTIFVSCEKMQFQNDIYGTWEIQWAGGGLYLHAIETNFSHLKINKSDQYFMYRNDSLKASGNYTICKTGYDPYQKKETFEMEFKKGIKQDPKIRFPFDDKLDTRFFSNDTLIFSENCADCYQYCFVRLK